MVFGQVSFGFQLDDYRSLISGRLPRLYGSFEEKRKRGSGGRAHCLNSSDKADVSQMKHHGEVCALNRLPV